jgi:two-component system alkaline phosphatase synthesis response regulator PhoP
MSATKILLVDDEEDIIEFLRYNLVHEGFQIITAHNGFEALSKINEKPDLIILDVMMPKMNGYEVFAKIKEIKSMENVPVIFLTAKSSELDEIHALNLGADDFIQKPISMKKIIARIKANLRKSGKITDSAEPKKKVIEIGHLYIDIEQFIVKIDGQEVFLPKKEFEILSYLASNPNIVFSREQLLRDIWGSDVLVIDRTVDVHVRKIREKLGTYSDFIETIKGVGYKFRKN